MKNLKFLTLAIAIILAGSSFKGFTPTSYHIIDTDGQGNFIVELFNGTCDQLNEDPCRLDIDDSFVHDGKVSMTDAASHGTRVNGDYTPNP